ncbi:hypothetical protein [uncultured Subdoligranulum sp.]|uniref:hypothetical protein n=1 Tax=uncultured Subdoligranulum sp. TaxID=512298 RepID=UPI002637B8AA|nr:hypothetical protein [uncultured Subdoligranulum sp.]
MEKAKPVQHGKTILAQQTQSNADCQNHASPRQSGKVNFSCDGHGSLLSVVFTSFFGLTGANPTHSNSVFFSASHTIERKP